MNSPAGMHLAFLPSLMVLVLLGGVEHELPLSNPDKRQPGCSDSHKRVCAAHCNPSAGQKSHTNNPAYHTADQRTGHIASPVDSNKPAVTNPAAG